MILDFHITSKEYNQKIFIESTTHTFSACKCEHCGAMGRFHRHASYSRYFITFDAEIPQVETLQILRVQCLSCKKTHGVLPQDVIPFQIHSMNYILLLLYTFYNKSNSKRGTAKEMGCNLDFVRKKLLLFQKYLISIEAYLREIGQWDSTSHLCAKEALSFLCHRDFDFRAYFSTHHIPIFLNRRNTATYPLRFIPFVFP